MDFKDYLFYKNIIIFIVDTAKKLKNCELIVSLNKDILFLELLCIKKAINFNHYIY